MNKYQKINEYLSHGDVARASDLFHSIVTEAAREIYSAMESDDDLEHLEHIGGDAADDLISDVSTDERSQEMRNMEEDSDKKPATKSAPYRSDVVPNVAKLTPAPKPVNTQPDQVNNRTPFPKVD